MNIEYLTLIDGFGNTPSKRNMSRDLLLVLSTRIWFFTIN